jgi:probable HAF family extracellular repeat protein
MKLISAATLLRAPILALTLGFLAGLFNAMAQQPSPQYTIIDLGAVGGPPGQPITLKNNGLVSGQAAASDGSMQANLWFRGVRADISRPGLGGKNSLGFGVNELGQAVGAAETLASDPNGEDFCGFQFFGFSPSPTVCSPFLWQHGVMSPLPTLGGHNGAANQINNRGVAAGVGENTTTDSDCVAPQKYQFKPVTWQQGQIHELSTYGDPDGIAFAINDHGQVVGASGNCGAFNPNTYVYLAPVHALLWETGTVTDLRNLGGAFGNIALGINNLGHVVGGSDTTGDTTSHAFLWTRDTGMQDLGTLAGDVFSTAIGINDAGQIVGVSADANFNIRAFVRLNAQLQDLNSLIAGDSPLYLLLACSINSSGQIIGLAFDTTSNDLHGYLATPKYGAAAQTIYPAPGLSSKTAPAADVRRLLRELHFGRFGAGPMRER